MVFDVGRGGSVALPGVAQRDAAIKDGVCGIVVMPVCDEVAQAFKLECVFWCGLCCRWFDVAMHDAFGVWVEEVAVGFSVGVVVGFFNGEQPVVQADFRCYSVWCADPVDGAFDFAVSAFHAGT